MQDISDLHAAYRRGERSPVDVVDEMLAAIDSSPLNAYITVMHEEARQQAKQAQADIAADKALGPLHGVPVAVKDLIDVAGVPCTMGSQQYAHNVATRDAHVVKQLRDAGAILMGKTNTHEFAYGSSGDRSYFGAARNPHSIAHMTGGSSSGSAAALGAGLAWAALGTDTSASVRIPAALCGVVGMKPTYDLVSRQGVFTLSQALDHVGPMTRSVRDNALMLGLIAGRSAESYTELLESSIRGKTVGIAMEFYDCLLSEEVRRVLGAACDAFREAGANVVSVFVPNIEAIYDAQQFILKAEAYTEHRSALLRGALYQEEVRERLMKGANVERADYLQALESRSMARGAFDQVLEQVDLIVCASCGITAPLIDERVSHLAGQDYSTPWLLTRLTAPTNFSGHPSLSVPFGADRQGLPIGIQLIGRHHDEAQVYQFGRVLEQARTSSDEPS